jgi:hypothetical protein
MPNTPYLLSSFNELTNYYNIGNARWRVTNVLGASEVEEQCVRIL